MTTDPYVMTALQAALILFTVWAAIRDWRIRVMERVAEAKASVTRAATSMTPIYTVYGAAVASCLVLIDKASGTDGNKVVLIVIDFACLTYLFFFSTWFRNAVFFSLLQRVRRD